MCEVKDSDIKEIKEAIGRMTTDFAVMNNNIEKQADVIEKLTESFAKLSIFIEKTNENNKKIDYLFKRTDDIYNAGTKACPLNTNKLQALRDDFTGLEKRMDRLNGYLVGIGIGIIMQFLAILVYLIEKHLV